MKCPGAHLATVQTKRNRAANGKGFVFTVKIIGRGVRGFNRTQLHCINHTKGWHQLACRMDRDFKPAAGNNFEVPRKNFSAAVDGVKRLGKARCESPANQRLRVHCRGNARCQNACYAGVLDKRATVQKWVGIKGDAHA